VEHDGTGTSTYAGDAESLAWGIGRVFEDPSRARRLADAARERTRTVFHWDALAGQTKGVYDRVWKEYLASGWGA
ncbi:MAG: glycosyltransferase, partial [Armatimonadota bacterium]